jgi:hypothetical protein
MSRYALEFGRHRRKRLICSLKQNESKLSVSFILFELFYQIPQKHVITYSKKSYRLRFVVANISELLDFHIVIQINRFTKLMNSERYQKDPV